MKRKNRDTKSGTNKRKEGLAIEAKKRCSAPEKRKNE